MELGRWEKRKSEGRRKASVQVGRTTEVHVRTSILNIHSEAVHTEGYRTTHAKAFCLFICVCGNEGNGSEMQV